MTIGIGVIGCGRIGRLHAEHVAFRIGSTRLVGVTDVNRAAARATATALGGAVSEDAAALLSDSAVDAVLICSSTDTHADLIEAAAGAGKHIFCEKPIDRDLARIDAALRAVARAGVKLQIGFNRRFDPNFQYVHEQVAAGRIGDPHLIRITSRDPAPPPIEYIRVSGGLFFDMSIHDFDMARYLSGAEVESVFATGRVRVDPAIGEAGDIDTAVVVLEMEGGCLVTIDNSRRAVYGYDQRVEVFGPGGTIWAENDTPHRTGIGDETGMHRPRPKDFFIDRYGASYIREIQAFAEAIVHDTEPAVTGADGRLPVAIALAAARSLSEGRRVALREVL
jgi:myo-inositol 2-dehydrogenase/D-chiro-inositol 1-dehydrogenase